MWFGFDWPSKAAVVVVMTFFPMLVNTVAGLAAGLSELDAGGSSAEWTLLASCDLANPLPALGRLLAAWSFAVRSDEVATDEHDGWCLADADDRPQWLLGIHRTSALRQGLERLGSPRDRSLRELFAEATLVTLPASRDDVIVMRTFSKLFGMAGMRLGLTIASPALHERMMRYDGGQVTSMLPMTAVACGTGFGGAAGRAARAAGSAGRATGRGRDAVTDGRDARVRTGNVAGVPGGAGVRRRRSRSVVVVRSTGPRGDVALMRPRSPGGPGTTAPAGSRSR